MFVINLILYTYLALYFYWFRVRITARGADRRWMNPEWFIDTYLYAADGELEREKEWRGKDGSWEVSE